MVLLVFSLLCFCFALIPPLYSVATAVSSVSTIPGSSGSGSLFFFSGSFCCFASLHCSFIALSVLNEFFFFFSASGPPVSFAVSVSISSCQAFPGGFVVVVVAPVFGAVPVSRIISSPFSATSLFRPFAGSPPPSVVVPAATLPSAFHSTPSALMVYPGTSSSSSATPPPPCLLVPSFVAPDEFCGIQLRPLCFTMRTRRFLMQFRGLCGLNVDACSLSLGIASRRLWVFTLLRLSCLLVLVCGGPHGPFSAAGSRLVSFLSSGRASFFFSLLTTRLMLSRGCSF